MRLKHNTRKHLLTLSTVCDSNLDRPKCPSSMSTTNTDKMFILNDTAKKDAAVQLAMANYLQQLKREHQQREAIRAGLITPQPTTVWNISDRD